MNPLQSLAWTAGYYIMCQRVLGEPVDPKVMDKFRADAREAAKRQAESGK